MRNALAIFISEGERIGQPFNHWQIAYHQAWRWVLEGDLAAAEQAAADALNSRHSRPANPTRSPSTAPNSSACAISRAGSSRMVPLIEQAVTDNPGLPAFRAALAWAKSHDAADSEVRRLLDIEVSSTSRCPRTSSG